MISKAIQFTGDILDTFFKERFSITGSSIAFGTTLQPDGSINDANTDKVLISLVNVDKNAAKAPISFGYKTAAEKAKDEAKAGNYTLYLMVSANYTDYLKSIDFLDAVITFFADHTSLEATAYPGMPAGVTKMEFAQESAEASQMRSIWLALGARYQPSVVYKVTVTAGA